MNTTTPQDVFEGGTVPVDAEAIERRLEELWQPLGCRQGEGHPLVRQCLSNILVVTDDAARPHAERLAAELTALQASRVLLLVIDESFTTYEASVRTACRRASDAHTIVCWEVIDILCPPACTESIPGVVRSLVVGTVPVITVDFRRFLQSPAFDATLVDLSDYCFANAEVVPTRELRRRWLPMRWYRTLPVRELLADAVDLLLEERPGRKLREVTVFASRREDRTDVLVAGWLVYRLSRRGVLRTSPHGLTVDTASQRIDITVLDRPDPTGLLVRTTWDDDIVVSITETAPGTDQPAAYTADIGTRRLHRSLDSYPLGRYIIQATHVPSEFVEYDAARKVVMETKLGRV